VSRRAVAQPGEGQADLAQVVLTAGNWNVAQTVTVTGQDDAIDDGNVGYAIVLAQATSGGLWRRRLRGGRARRCDR
jgi:hypothetical protein